MPIYAVNQMAAAVVRFVILFSDSFFMIIPAPRNPIADIICAAILEDEFGSTIEERNVKIAAPSIARQCVLIPADRYVILYEIGSKWSAFLSLLLQIVLKKWVLAMFLSSSQMGQ